MLAGGWMKPWRPSGPSRREAPPRVLDTLAVKGRSAKDTYDRSAFGQAWPDVDRNGCDTRNDILRRDLKPSTLKPGRGTAWCSAAP